MVPEVVVSGVLDIAEVLDEDDPLLLLLLIPVVVPLMEALETEDEATVFIVVAVAVVAGEAAIELYLGKEPAAQRHWQSHAPAALIFPVPMATWPEEATDADPVVVSQLLCNFK